MKKRLLKCSLALAALTLLGFFAPSLYWQIAGRWRGEAFYAGRPTSYWRSQIIADHIRSMQDSARDIRINLGGGTPTWQDRFAAWKERWMPSQSTQQLFESDKRSLSVCRTLMRDSHEEVVRVAYLVSLKHLMENSTENRDLLPDVIDCWMTRSQDRYLAWGLPHIILAPQVFNKEVVPLFCSRLSGTEKRRTIMALGLMTVQVPEAIPPVVAGLEGDDGEIFADGLSLAMTQDGFAAVNAALNSGHRQTRLRATRALAETGGSGALELLKQLAADADPTIRAAATIPPKSRTFEQIANGER